MEYPLYPLQNPDPEPSQQEIQHSVTFSLRLDFAQISMTSRRSRAVDNGTKSTGIPV